MKTKLIKIIKRVLITGLITVVLLEITLRIFGYRTYEIPEFSIKSTPAEHISPDNKLGIHLNPGTYEVLINNTLSYTATHNKYGQRTCGNMANEGGDTSITIAFHGCSFTYGMGVDDEQTYPFLLQRHFSNLKIENYGVPGYGQVQTIIELDKKGPKPDYLVLNYLSFHNERNALNPAYQKKLRDGFHISMKGNHSLKIDEIAYPYGIIVDNKLQLESMAMSDILNTFPLISYSASLNALQNLSDKVKTDEQLDEQITLAMLEYIDEQCTQQGIELIVSYMLDDAITQRLIKRCEQLAIPTIDLTIDLSKPENTNGPSDPHPSPRAHDYFAQTIILFFKEIE